MFSILPVNLGNELPDRVYENKGKLKNSKLKLFSKNENPSSTEEIFGYNIILCGPGTYRPLRTVRKAAALFGNHRPYAISFSYQCRDDFLAFGLCACSIEGGEAFAHILFFSIKAPTNSYFCLTPKITESVGTNKILFKIHSQI